MANLTNPPRAFGRIGPRGGRQAGLVLVIGLLFLLILAMVSSASMNSTVMAEKMASNNQYKSVSFQAAESTIERHWTAVSIRQAIDSEGYQFDSSLAREFDPIVGGAIATTSMAQLVYCGERSAEGTGMNADLSTGTVAVKLHAVDVSGLGDIAAMSATVVNQRRAGFFGPTLNIRQCPPDY